MPAGIPGGLPMGGCQWEPAHPGRFLSPACPGREKDIEASIFLAAGQGRMDVAEAYAALAAAGKGNRGGDKRKEPEVRWK